MKALALAGWRPILTAFVIWFAHFMLCWVAVEIWPDRWIANVLGWVFTALALAALAVHAKRLAASTPRGELTRWTHRFAWGAIALSTAGVVFVALPAVMLLP